MAGKGVASASHFYNTEELILLQTGERKTFEDPLFTDLASHDRSKEESSAQAEGEDLTGDSLVGFPKVCRLLKFQRSSITWGWNNKRRIISLHAQIACYLMRLEWKMAWTYCRRCYDWPCRRGCCSYPCRHRREKKSHSDTMKQLHHFFFFFK